MGGRSAAAAPRYVAQLCSRLSSMASAIPGHPLSTGQHLDNILTPTSRVHPQSRTTPWSHGSLVGNLHPGEPETHSIWRLRIDLLQPSEYHRPLPLPLHATATQSQTNPTASITARETPVARMRRRPESCGGEIPPPCAISTALPTHALPFLHRYKTMATRYRICKFWRVCAYCECADQARDSGLQGCILECVGCCSLVHLEGIFACTHRSRCRCTVAYLMNE